MSLKKVEQFRIYSHCLIPSSHENNSLYNSFKQLLLNRTLYLIHNGQIVVSLSGPGIDVGELSISSPAIPIPDTSALKNIRSSY